MKRNSKIATASDSESRQLGPYHPSRRAMIRPIPAADCAYFTCDSGKLMRLSEVSVERAWRGYESSDAMLAAGDLPLLTIVLALRPGAGLAYFMQVCVEDGVITPASQVRAINASVRDNVRRLRGGVWSRPTGLSDEDAIQYGNWPTDWKQQVIAELRGSDDLSERGVGGPLCVSLRLAIDVRAAAMLLTGTRPTDFVEPLSEELLTEAAK